MGQKRQKLEVSKLQKNQTFSQSMIPAKIVLVESRRFFGWLGGYMKFATGLKTYVWIRHKGSVVSQTWQGPRPWRWCPTPKEARTPLEKVVGVSHEDLPSLWGHFLDSISTEAYILAFVCLLHLPACPVQSVHFRREDVRVGDRKSGLKLRLCLFFLV